MSKCPKCNRTMTFQSNVSSSSGLHRNGGSLVSGMSCYNCGTWVEPTFEPVFKYEGKMDKGITEENRESVSIKAGKRRLSEYDRAAWKFRKLIDENCTEASQVEAVASKIIDYCKDLTYPKRMQASIHRYRSGRLAKLMEDV